MSHHEAWVGFLRQNESERIARSVAKCLNSPWSKIQGASWDGREVEEGSGWWLLIGAELSQEICCFSEEESLCEALSPLILM